MVVENILLFEFYSKTTKICNIDVMDVISNLKDPLIMKITSLCTRIIATRSLL